MRVLISLLLAAAMGLPSMAAEPLPPGKPAGVKQAVSEETEIFWMLGVGLGGAASVASVMHIGSSSTTGTSG